MSSSSINKSLNLFHKEEVSFWKRDQDKINNQVKIVKKKINADEKRFSPKELFKRMENAVKEADRYWMGGMGPVAGVGIGCGVGVGIGVGIGWVDESSFQPWNKAPVVFGVGAGCGVAAGFGYGFGLGKGVERETIEYGHGSIAQKFHLGPVTMFYRTPGRSFTIQTTGPCSVSIQVVPCSKSEYANLRGVFGQHKSVWQEKEVQGQVGLLVTGFEL